MALSGEDEVDMLCSNQKHMWHIREVSSSPERSKRSRSERPQLIGKWQLLALVQEKRWGRQQGKAKK